MKKYQLKWRVSSNNKELGQLFNQMILSMFPISSREASGLFLCKIVLNFICGNSAKISSLVGEESARIGFFEEHIERELDLVRQCMVGKQGSIF